MMLRLCSPLLCAALLAACAFGPPAAPDDDASVKVGKDGHRYRCDPACKEWGESCVDTGAGGQRCRRICLRFGEECYRIEPGKSKP